MPDNWEDIPDKPRKGIWKPKLGEIIEGEVVRIEDGKYGYDHIIRLQNGEEMKLPAHKQLASKLEDVKVGMMIRVTQTGEKSSGKGNPTQMYKVAINHGYIRQAKIDVPVLAQDSPIGKIISSLRDGSKWFKDGLIPIDTVRQAIVVAGFAGTACDETLKSFKDKSLIIEPVTGFFKVV